LISETLSLTKVNEEEFTELLDIASNF